MARSSITRPARTLGVLVALLAVVYALVGVGVLWSDAAWTPKLALDLEGGTQIVLTPRTVDGSTGQVSQTAVDQAVEIIRQRVNGSGVSEAEVTTTGSGIKTKITVSLPGKPDKKTEALVTQAAQLRFRAVLATAAGSPQPVATDSPTATSSGSSSGTASPSSSATATPSAAASPSTTLQPSATTSSNGRAVPRALLAATPSPTTPASTTPAAATPSAAVTPSAATTTPAAASSGAVGTPAATPTAAPTPTNARAPNWVDAALAAKFEALDCSQPQNRQGGGGDDPAKPLVACKTDGAVKYILGPAEVVGTDVKAASFGLEVNSQGVTGTAYEVDLSFTSEGAKKFAAVTTRLAGLQNQFNQFAIVLDGLVVSDPGTNEPITTGNARITGGFSLETAQTLANQLEYGALPLSFRVDTKETISATLGREQLQRGLLAGLIGLALVVIYSLLQYRALGLVTVASLVIAGGVTYGLVALLSWRQGYRLSLPGVAGLIVAIGITADSFIVYFERVRDEVRDGRPLRTAVEVGWQRARRTIIASDAVSFLAAVVLYLLAVGGVRGFAFTLGLTTVVDIAVVFLFTHPTVVLLARTVFFGDGHVLSGFDPAHLGRSVAYSGRGRVRQPAPVASVEPDDAFVAAAAVSDPSGPSSGGGGGRLTIAERRAAARKATAADEPVEQSSTTTSGRDS